MTDAAFSLSGRRVLVTGGSTGIGAAIAARFARAGARVAVAARRRGPLEDLRAELAAEGLTITPFVADLADPADLEVLVPDAVAALGGLDVLVNNAGRADWLPFDSIDRERFDAVFQLNVWAPLRLVQLARPHLAAGGAGVVLNIGSVDAVRPSAGAALYGASKAALRALTVALAKELAPDGTVVSQIDPGLVRTPLAVDAVASLERSGAAINLAGRPGEPDEIAALALYLASPAGRFTSGTSFVVDGGALATGPFDMLPDA